MHFELCLPRRLRGVHEAMRGLEGPGAQPEGLAWPEGFLARPDLQATSTVEVRDHSAEVPNVNESRSIIANVEAAEL